MLSLTTLDILYIVLTIFVSIIGTLLAIVLFRVIKILGPILEIAGYYKQFKSYLSLYSQIPVIIKEKIVEFIGNIGKNKTESSDENNKEEIIETKKSSN